ncbi:dTDP-4-dehydrorhamnose reductase [Formosa algae]|uniref:dTDP-4-dehydrorhamnose reductase n=1 Tax=Formosa algae TaxID=225843 RepID=A0A9X1CA98_9FLAO|nr:dTDP-4-dehydrorhamnose reductase [Formosa algae]MBP1838697.1 dTDP-4-dehydrorhamnose reductase [Formosa algae]MDQ0335197.1 dTDP-4-dehydrorhamnose reductase [Formosa algae]OEI81632.1 dTDP-4-dehydrorhamnose reductase [Formosa algae]
MKILVTGGNGQLAACIKDVSKGLNDLEFIYTDSEDLDITNQQHVAEFFQNNNIDWCINCAAYTAVDKAETDVDLARKVNKDGAKNLALACKSKNVKLIHVSTDFVFDGTSSTLYSETDSSEPIGVYGLTKLEGEHAIQDNLESYFILRTSWLYSEHANNFMKTMLRLAETRPELSVVADQIGTPTYATDLASVMLNIINNNSTNYGLYHYSNEGVASWYDFAAAIFEIADTKTKVFPIKTEAYPTPAARPQFSVMDKSKIKETFKIEIPHWRDSLKVALKNL